MIKEIFKGTVAAIKKLAQVKAAVDAFDDDTDLDGVPQYEEFKQCFHKGHALIVNTIIPDAKRLVEIGQEAFVLAVGLLEHIAKAVKEA